MAKLLIAVLLCGLCTTSAVALAASVDEILGSTGTRKTGSLGAVSNFRGQFRSVNYSVLSSGVAAQVIAFPVRTGERVKKGDVIAEFDCDLVRVDLQMGKARMESAAKVLDVNRRLSALKSVSELDLSISIAELKIATAEAERTTEILEECVIYAPFSGTVTQKFVQAYEFVNLGDQLVELVDTENLEVEMVLPSKSLMAFTKGTLFTMVVDETGKTVQAEVDRVVDVIDPVSQTVRVIGKLTGSTSGLMPGMSGVVVFNQN